MEVLVRLFDSVEMLVRLFDSVKVLVRLLDSVEGSVDSVEVSVRLLDFIRETSTGKGTRTEALTFMATLNEN